MQIEDNKERGLSECNFLRQTGRTTAMVIEALEFLKKNTSNDECGCAQMCLEGLKPKKKHACDDLQTDILEDDHEFRLASEIGR